ncbi:MAG: uroporphyrinogen-III C-methyltransferase, partial [Cyanobacteria bacterium P01_E01_bin.48]
MSCYGKVWLVGAGLGNHETLTTQSLQLLQTADTVVTDDLVPRQLLLAASLECTVIPVGKRGGQASTPQADINRLLVQLSHSGQTVVRLKSGDPGVFGRLTEEVRALEAANCPFEIVPGISSAIAGPLAAGIPLTDKHLSQSFVVASVHQVESLPWHALAGIDTLVLLMGTRSLRAICERLVQAGKSPDEPIACIREAGRASQQMWT